ncbi:MAG TPA: hypothetical protein VIT21_12275 [Chthoniobacterales bacterium]
MCVVLYNRPTNQRKGIRRKIFLCCLLLMALFAATSAEARLSPLAETPDWAQLYIYQRTITREDFLALLNRNYAPNNAARGLISVDRDRARILTTLGGDVYYDLYFAESQASTQPLLQYWRPIRPGNLKGKKIALDPGHIGGKYAKMEERWFKIGDSEPVMEGEMVLIVAKKIAKQLKALGADVEWVRNKNKPLTRKRPRQLEKVAEHSLQEKMTPGIHFDYFGPADPLKTSSIKWEAERLFYRVSEIRARADRNNEKLRPDLTICLHFNAEEWGDPSNPTFVPQNHLHFLVNGSYSAEELQYDDIRFEMIRKLLSRSLSEEIPLAERLAKQMALETGLPPYRYPKKNAILIGSTRYVWSRNLLANRLYQNPTLYVEPYVMNNAEVFDRIQLGDYSGTRLVNGVLRKSIFQEYADAVVNGLR